MPARSPLFYIHGPFINRTVHDIIESFEIFAEVFGPPLLFVVQLSVTSLFPLVLLLLQSGSSDESPVSVVVVVVVVVVVLRLRTTPFRVATTPRQPLVRRRVRVTRSVHRLPRPLRVITVVLILVRRPLQLLRTVASLPTLPLSPALTLPIRLIVVRQELTRV